MSKKRNAPQPPKRTPVRPAQTPARPVAANRRRERAVSTGGDWLTFALVVLAITTACYFPSLSNKLVNWDDDPNITENPNLEMVEREGMFSTIGDIFHPDRGNVIGNYNPLPILTFAIEKAIAGEFNTTLIHSTNLLFHLITVFFVFKLLLAMGIGRWGAAFGGLLFGIHPMRVESVAWATERKDVLFAAFFFMALVWYVKWLKNEDAGKRMGLYIAMLVFALLSLFSKVQAVALPLSMLVLDYWFRRPLNFKLVWEKIPFWILSFIFGLLNLYTLRQAGSTNDDITGFNVLDRLCIGMYSFCVYLYKLIIPYPMSPLYPYPKPLPMAVYASPVLFATAWFLVWMAWKSDRRESAAATSLEPVQKSSGAVWVAGVLFFFFNVGFLLQWFGAGQGYLADRFTYVPYFGFFAVAAWYFDRYVEQPAYRSALQIGAVLLFAVFGIWTVRQIGIWKNGATLWTHVMKFEKDNNATPYWNRGQYLRNVDGDYESALQDYNIAVKLDPKNPDVFNSRGKTFFDMSLNPKYRDKAAEYGQKALDDYNTALSLPAKKNASRAEMLINRGAAWGARGDYGRALQDLNEGIRLDSTNKNGYLNRSIVLFSLQRFPETLRDYRTYQKLDPYNGSIWYESGMINRVMGKSQDALADLNRAIELKPELGLAYLERARAYAQMGNKSAAQQDYQRAQQMGQKMNDIDARLMGQ